MLTSVEFDKLKADSASLHRLRTEQMLKPFVDEMTHALGMALAHMPYDQWPNVAKAAFEHVAAKQQTSAFIYKDLLPQG